MSESLELKPQEGAPLSEEQKLDPYEESAVVIKHMNLTFKHAIDKLREMRKDGPSRVLRHLIYEGLEELPPLSGKEQSLLDLCKQLTYHRNMVLEYALMKKGELSESEEK